MSVTQCVPNSISRTSIADGVAVVLYNMMNTMAEIEAAGEVITLSQIGLGLASFITVACGGLLIGIIMGVLTALITRTTSEVRGKEYLLYISDGPKALFGEILDSRNFDFGSDNVYRNRKHTQKRNTCTMKMTLNSKIQDCL